MPQESVTVLPQHWLWALQSPQIITLPLERKTTERSKFVFQKVPGRMWALVTVVVCLLSSTTTLINPLPLLHKSDKFKGEWATSERTNKDTRALPSLCWGAHGSSTYPERRRCPGELCISSSARSSSWYSGSLRGRSGRLVRRFKTINMNT